MLSPLDLKNKMMEPKKRKYYDKDETDDYLELVMEQYKQLYDENLELQKNVKSLNDGVQYYRSIENTMQKALVLAEKTAKETKDAAQLKAEAIEKDANTKADKIVAEAEQEYDKLKEKGYRILSEKVAQEVDSYWVNTEEMDIYFGGGTTQRMKIYNGTLVEAPQMATAKGLYIVGTKVFK